MGTLFSDNALLFQGPPPLSPCLPSSLGSAFPFSVRPSRRKKQVGHGAGIVACCHFSGCAAVRNSDAFRLHQRPHELHQGYIIS
eukprot:s1501_g17.t1